MTMTIHVVTWSRTLHAGGCVLQARFDGGMWPSLWHLLRATFTGRAPATGCWWRRLYPGIPDPGPAQLWSLAEESRGNAGNVKPRWLGARELGQVQSRVSAHIWSTHHHRWIGYWSSHSPSWVSFVPSLSAFRLIIWYGAFIILDPIFFIWIDIQEEMIVYITIVLPHNFGAWKGTLTKKNM